MAIKNQLTRNNVSGLVHFLLMGFNGLAVVGIMLVVNSCNQNHASAPDIKASFTQYSNSISSTLLVGSKNNELMAFAVQSQGDSKLTYLSFQIVNATSSNTLISNVKLIKSIDSDFSSTNDNVVIASGVMQINSISFSSLNESIGSTTHYYFLVADAGTPSNNSTLQLSLNSGNVTVSSGSVVAFSFTSPVFQFSSQSTNAISLNQLSKGLSVGIISSNLQNVALVGFSIAAQQATQLSAISFPITASAPNLFGNVKLIISVDDDFSTKNDNTIVSSTGTLSTSAITFTGLTEPIGTTTKNYFVAADIGSVAGTVQMKLNDTNVTVKSGTVTPFQISLSYTILSQPVIGDNANYFYVYGTVSTNAQSQIVFTPDNTLTSLELRPYNFLWGVQDVGDNNSIFITASGIALNRNNQSYKILPTIPPIYPHQTDSIKVFERVLATDPYHTDSEFKPTATHIDNNYVVIAIDVSPSLGPDIMLVKSSAKKMANKILGSSPNARVAVIGFATDVKTLAFTGDSIAVRNFINPLSLGDYTALYDAMKTGVDMLTLNMPNFVSGSLVTFTDGHNNNSTSTFDQINALIQSDAFKKKVTSYTIGYNGKGDVEPDKLRALSTNSQFFEEPLTIDGVSQVFKTISDKTSEVYTIYYKRGNKIPQPVYIRIEIRAVKKN